MAPVELSNGLGIAPLLDVKSSVATDPPNVPGGGNRTGHSISMGFDKMTPSWQNTALAMRSKIDFARRSGKYTS
jgi:hypothetical protein